MNLDFDRSSWATVLLVAGLFALIFGWDAEIVKANLVLIAGGIVAVIAAIYLFATSHKK